MRQVKKDRRFSPCSESKKRQISESLSGQKFGGEVQIDPKAGAELRSSVKVGDAFVHQGIVDWWRDLKRM